MEAHFFYQCKLEVWCKKGTDGQVLLLLPLLLMQMVEIEEERSIIISITLSSWSWYRFCCCDCPYNFCLNFRFVACDICANVLGNGYQFFEWCRPEEDQYTQRILPLLIIIIILLIPTHSPILITLQSYKGLFGLIVIISELDTLSR